MIENVLDFFSDLILFTAGLAVITLWIFIFIEIYDTIVDVIRAIFRGESTASEEDEDYDR